MAESAKKSMVSSKKWNVIVLLDDGDERTAKLVNSPRKKLEDDPTFSDISKPSEDNSISEVGENKPFSSETQKEIVQYVDCFFLYCVL